MDKITFCIPSKSNVRYLKTCIPSIRKNAYRDDHEIIIFVDSDEDGTIEWLDSIKDEYNVSYYVNPDLGNSLYGIGRAYDYCVEKSTTDIFMIFHADMMLGKHADLKAFNHLKEKTVVCSTRIEPPIHPNGGEKILEDFGMWPEEFKETEFDQYVNKHLKDNKITEGIFAPWMMYKSEFLSIGGHDPIMKSAREDSDVFNRLHLDGFKFIQPWNSLVYHLTGRGGQFQHGEITQNHEQKSQEWQKLMHESTMDFIRKWGSSVQHTPLMKPIVIPKYDIGFILKGNNLKILQALEPWCSTIYVDPHLIQDYITAEQPHTCMDLNERVKPYNNEKNNQILVEVNCTLFNQQDYQYIQQLSNIIANDEDLNKTDNIYVEKFELGNLKITIMALDTLEKELIICKT